MRLLTLVKCELRCRLRTDPLQIPVALALVVTGATAFTMLLAIDNIANSHVPALGLSTSLAASSEISANVAAHKGSSIFTALGLLFIALATATAPLAGCATLNRERDAGGFEQLLQTGVNSLTILAAKCIAAVLRCLLIVVSSAPLLATAWYFEGASSASIIIAATGIVGIAILGSALGIFASSVFRSNVSALVGSQILLAIGVLLGPISSAFAWVQGMPGVWTSLLYSSPPVVLVASHGDLWSALSAKAPYNIRDVLSLPAGQWLGTPAPYAFATASAAGCLLAAIVLLLLASVAMDPLHPVRTWRIGRGAGR